MEIIHGVTRAICIIPLFLQNDPLRQIIPFGPGLINRTDMLIGKPGFI
jgi:hypothetical protein